MGLGGEKCKGRGIGSGDDDGGGYWEQNGCWAKGGGGGDDGAMKKFSPIGVDSGRVTETSTAQQRGHVPEVGGVGLGLGSRVTTPTSDVGSGGASGEGVYCEEVTIRQWLSRPNRKVDRVESLHIFKQVLDFVDLAHGQGVMLRNIRPSCFLLSTTNKVAFIDSASARGGNSSDESLENSPGKASTSLEILRRSDGDGARRTHVAECRESPAAMATLPLPLPLSSRPTSSRQEGEYWIQEGGAGVNSGGGVREWSGSTGSGDSRAESSGGVHHSELDSSSGKRVRVSSDMTQRIGEAYFPQRQLLQLEQAWYTSPEELTTGSSSFASDVYSLGVLSFEVLLPQFPPSRHHLIIHTPSFVTRTSLKRPISILMAIFLDCDDVMCGGLALAVIFFVWIEDGTSKSHGRSSEPDSTTTSVVRTC